MAKIYGMELKSVKDFEGKQGNGFSANLYLNGKKMATCLDEANGGQLEITFETKLSKEKLKDLYTTVNKYYEDYPKYIISDANDYGKLLEMVEEIYSLKENENHFKKQVKKGAKGIVEVRYVKRNAPFNIYDYKAEELYVVKDLSTLDSLLKEVGAVEYSLYTDIEQFDIV